LELDDLEYLQDLRDQLDYQSRDAHLAAFSRSTGLSFWSNLAEDAFFTTGIRNISWGLRLGNSEDCVGLSWRRFSIQSGDGEERVSFLSNRTPCPTPFYLSKLPSPYPSSLLGKFPSIIQVRELAILHGYTLFLSFDLV
jgi:hypothetical protein